MVWERNRLQVLQSAENPSHKEGWERGTLRGRHKNISPKALTPQREGVNFVSFCKQWGSKPGVSQVPRIAGMETWGRCPTPGEKTGKQLLGRWHVLRITSVGRERLLVCFGTHLWGVALPPWRQRSWWAPFPLLLSGGAETHPEGS